MRAGTDRGAVGAVTHRAARSAAVRGAAEVLGKVATLAWTVVAARALSVADFGAVSYALGVMLLASSLASWGFDTRLVLQGSREPTSLGAAYGGALTWKTALGLPALAVGLVAAVATRASTEAWVVLLLVSLAGLPELWSHSARSVASARQQPGGIALALVAQRVATAVAVIGALVADAGAVGVAAGYLVGTLLGWAAHHVAVRRLGVRVGRRDLTPEVLRSAASGTLAVGASTLVLSLLFRVDVLLLEAFRGDEAVAVYSVAYRLLETVLFVTWAINQAVLPVMAHASAERRRAGLERAIAVAAAVYLPFLVVCLVEAEAALTLLFGERYGADAAPVLVWLAPAPLLLAAAAFGGSVLLAEGRRAVVLVAAVVALAANVGLNLALIPSLGGTGAAVATSVSYAIQVGVVLVATSRSTGPPRLLVPLLPSVAASALLGLALLPLRAPVLIELAVGAVVYVAAWSWVAGRAAPEQREVVAGLLRRRRSS